MTVYPVILCGGSGERLWPASRASHPKQFISLVGERSPFQETALRIAGLATRGEMLVVASAAHLECVGAQLAELDLKATILLEPARRDSACAVAAACAWIASQDSHGIAVVVASDHHIEDAAAFIDAVTIGATGAADGLIVTLGLVPNHPATAYGYISPGAPISANGLRTVAAFFEKPNAVAAATYVEAGYLWNSGNFIVAAATLLSELDRHAPTVSAAARQSVEEALVAENVVRLSNCFCASPRISIDYALMEKTDQAAVLPVSFAWSDLGSWDSVWAANDRDAQGNLATGDCLLIDTAKCLVRVADNMQVTVIGAHDIVVVADAGQVLVCAMNASQTVKTAVEQLKLDGRERLKAAAPFDGLEAATSWFDRWLRLYALPLWWSIGADHDRGGFHEALTLQGTPLDHPRRVRVQARQAFVYARAGLMGWSGPWRQAAWHGIDYLFAKYRRSDGLFRTLISADAAPIDETAMLYDQAFVLLAMAALYRVDRSAVLLAESHALLHAMQRLRHTDRGFREMRPHPFQSNAHMHLLEAALEWSNVGGGPEWDALAAEIADLALGRFIDRDAGFVREFFDSSWGPAAGEEGRRLEPGHQFEWAWLLARFGRRGHPSATTAAQKLYLSGLRGIDHESGSIALDALSVGDASPIRTARLWPQTEYLRAAFYFAPVSADVMDAAITVARFLDTPTLGLWRDAVNADGQFVDGPSPGSSLYHLVSALTEISGTHTSIPDSASSRSDVNRTTASRPTSLAVH